jgi:hypothetical protein
MFFQISVYCTFMWNKAVRDDNLAFKRQNDPILGHD